VRAGAVPADADGRRSEAIAVVVSLENRAVSSSGDAATARTALPDDGVITLGVASANPVPDCEAR
jgi:hypothetical protein